MKLLISKSISCSIVAAGFLSLFACSSSSSGNAVTQTSDAGTSSEAGASSDAAAPAASCDDGGAGGNFCTTAPSCATTVNGACTVTTVQAAGTLPTFTGGTVADGTYFLTAATTYGSSATAGQTQRVTMTFTAGAFTLVQDSDVSCNSAPSAAGTTSTSGTRMTLAVTCPGGVSESFSYTATPTTFSYSDASGTTGTLFDFTRQ